MKLQDSIGHSIKSGHHVLLTYLEDLSDEELLRKPAGVANTVKWQLGHLLHVSASILAAISPENPVELPEGFAEKYSKKNCQLTDASAFDSKELYFELFNRSMKKALEVLSNLSDEQFDEPTPTAIAHLAPTKGLLMNLLGLHLMMHVGQIAVLRRELDKPVKI